MCQAPRLDAGRQRIVASSSLSTLEGSVRRRAQHLHPARGTSGRSVTAVAVPLDVKARFGRDELVVSPCGEIDLATAPDLGALLDALAPARRRVVLDLADVDFMDAAGLRLIARLASRLEASGSELVIRSPAALTRRILDWSASAASSRPPPTRPGPQSKQHSNVAQRRTRRSSAPSTRSEPRRDGHANAPSTPASAWSSRSPLRP